MPSRPTSRRRSRPLGSARSGSRLGRSPRRSLLIACASSSSFPLLTMARFAFQKVPMILLGWSHAVREVDVERAARRRSSDPEFAADAVATASSSPSARSSLTLALLLPTALWVHLRLPKARRSSRSSPCCRTWCRRSPSSPGVIGVFQATRAVVLPHPTTLLVPVLRGAGDAVHVPGARRRDPGHRPAHPGRRLAVARRRLGHHAVPRADPQPARRARRRRRSSRPPSCSASSRWPRSLLQADAADVQRQLYAENFQKACTRSALLTLVVTTALLAGVTFVTRRRGAAAGLV